jgi:acyl carrier protein
VNDRLSAVVAAQLGLAVDAVTDEVGPRVLAVWTSLKHVQLMAAVEDEFGIKFEPREIRAVRTVGDLRQVLQSKGIGG